ncbi:hypothetical protein E2C01_072302 [Portunus trituberculatus]|uniref:Uncharacterized protein n=1 Tax=Portunus trituberculatus TaxID=210409 RepID=A0A5B7IAU5_PORTR|nr:hypothetical protein [Portunus trituberculatus]
MLLMTAVTCDDAVSCQERYWGSGEGNADNTPQGTLHRNTHGSLPLISVHFVKGTVDTQLI